jgi:hypothetical protein
MLGVPLTLNFQIEHSTMGWKTNILALLLLSLVGPAILISPYLLAYLGFIDPAELMAIDLSLGPFNLKLGAAGVSRDVSGTTRVQ